MGRKDIPETEREKLKKKFRGMMRALYRQEGAMLDVEVLRESEVFRFLSMLTLLCLIVRLTRLR